MLGMEFMVLTLNCVATLECFTDLNIPDSNACTPEKPVQGEGAGSLMAGSKS